jgi:hypothetical protein
MASRDSRVRGLGLCASALVLAACSSGPQGAVRPRPSTTTTAVGIRGSTPEQQAVLDAYAAVQAIVDAEVHNDPNWPGLFKTMVNPQLAHVQGLITTEKAQGYHSEGAARIVQAQVTSYSPAKADLATCVFDEVIARQADGSPVAGNAGRATYAVGKPVMVATGSGTWALQDGTVQQYPTAAEGGPLCAA